MKFKQNVKQSTVWIKENILNDKFPNGTEPVGGEVEEQRQELGEQNRVVLQQLVAEAAEVIELRRDVGSNLDGVNETCKPLSRSYRGHDSYHS